MDQFDVIIVGAGPAGITAALILGNAGLVTAVVEKERFPRSKTCGDGITPDVIHQLGKISPELQHKLIQVTETTAYDKLILTAPNNRTVVVPLREDRGFSRMYACRRIDFDRMMFDHLKQQGTVQIIEDCKVRSVEADQYAVKVNTSKGMLTAGLVIGTDGANSVVSKALRLTEMYGSDKAFAVRAYFRGIDYGEHGISPRVIFYRKLLPGYFWVFPFKDGSANVGLGITLGIIKKHHLKLEELLKQMTTSKEWQQMFRNAKKEGKVKGHIIPLGERGRPVSGQRILLAGDAAGLAHPLTAEGIGNAIRSGRIAAAHAQTCFLQDCFSSSFNKNYDKEIYRHMANEFRNFRNIQRLFRYPAILNSMARLASPRMVEILTNPDTITRLLAWRFLPFRLFCLMIRNR